MTEDKIKMPPEFSEAVVEGLNEAYNLAIDHAIEVVKGYFGYPANSDDPHAKPLISKLNQLKK